MENHKLKNEFRDKLEKDKVSSKEYVQRDLYAMLLQLRCRMAMCAADQIHMDSSIKVMEQYKAAIELLPESGGKAGSLRDADVTIESLEKQKELCFPARQQVITLVLLEEKFGKKNAALGEVEQTVELISGERQEPTDLETETKELMDGLDDDLRDDGDDGLDNALDNAIEKESASTEAAVSQD